MKKLFIMAFLAVGMAANAEEKNENVMLDNANAAASVVCDDADTNDGGVKLAKGKDEDDRWSMHFHVGWNIPTSKADGNSFAPFRSWEIGWTVVQYDWTPKNSKTTLSAGLGFDWRNYTLSGHDKLFEKADVMVELESGTAADDRVMVINRPGYYSELSSRIHTLALSMPLLVKQRFSKSFAVSLGAQLNWNYYARISNHFEYDDHEVEDLRKNIGERPITVDVLGIFHLGDFGVYCKYSPMSVLKKDKGPDFKSLSVGIYF